MTENNQEIPRYLQHLFRNDEKKSFEQHVSKILMFQEKSAPGTSNRPFIDDFIWKMMKVLRERRNSQVNPVQLIDQYGLFQPQGDKSQPILGHGYGSTVQ